jgi:hypothetical protein
MEYTYCTSSVSSMAGSDRDVEPPKSPIHMYINTLDYLANFPKEESHGRLGAEQTIEG